MEEPQGASSAPVEGPEVGTARTQGSRLEVSTLLQSTEDRQVALRAETVRGTPWRPPESPGSIPEQKDLKGAQKVGGGGIPGRKGVRGSQVPLLQCVCVTLQIALGMPTTAPWDAQRQMIPLRQTGEGSEGNLQRRQTSWLKCSGSRCYEAIFDYCRR